MGSEDGCQRWMSYDSVVDTYQRVAVPSFLPLAEDLITAIRLRPGERLLDVGTGTGLVAGLATSAVTPTGLVIGLDPSLGMLRRASARAINVVVAMAPGLPIAGGTVDAVVANLVLSHLPDLTAGMADIARTIRPGGRLGATAWAPQVPGGPGNDQPEADQMVARVKEDCRFQPPPSDRSAVPFESWLQESERLSETMVTAGLLVTSVELHRYQRAVPVDDFLSGWGSQGRYLRHTVGQPRWTDFVERASGALHDRFGARISCVNEAWIAVGQKQ